MFPMKISLSKKKIFAFIYGVIIAIYICFLVLLSYLNGREIVTEREVNINPEIVHRALVLNGAKRAYFDVNSDKFYFYRDGKKCVLFNSVVLNLMQKELEK